MWGRTYVVEVFLPAANSGEAMESSKSAKARSFTGYPLSVSWCEGAIDAMMSEAMVHAVSEAFEGLGIVDMRDKASREFILDIKEREDQGTAGAMNPEK